MKHAEKLIGRILFLEGLPTVSRLNTVHIGAGCPQAAQVGPEAELVQSTGTTKRSIWPTKSVTRPRERSWSHPARRGPTSIGSKNSSIRSPRWVSPSTCRLRPRSEVNLRPLSLAAFSYFSVRLSLIADTDAWQNHCVVPARANRAIHKPKLRADRQMLRDRELQPETNRNHNLGRGNRADRLIRGSKIGTSRPAVVGSHDPDATGNETLR